MEIHVIEKNKNVVRVSTAIGDFNAYWCSSVPAEYRKYIVELDSDVILTIDDIELSNSTTSCINDNNGKCILTGVIEDIQNDILVFRIHNSIMMLEISSTVDFLPFVNRFVRITLPQINLFDMELCC